MKNSIPHFYRLIGSATGWGARIRQTQKAPFDLKTKHIEENLLQQGVSCQWGPIISSHLNDFSLRDMPQGKSALPYVLDQATYLKAAVMKSLEKNVFPIVLGGDHAASIGSFSGLAASFTPSNSLGVIWLDAHMDAHTPQTTPSHAYHGMPVAALLGYGDPSLIQLFPSDSKLLPQNLVLIGIRSYEAEEEALLKRLGVRVYLVDEVKKRGFFNVFKEALIQVSANTKAVGISLDLDIFDPSFAPGIGSPAKNGLSPEDVLPALSAIWEFSPQCKLFEIVEYNPDLDKNEKTFQLISSILTSFCTTQTLAAS